MWCVAAPYGTATQRTASRVKEPQVTNQNHDPDTPNPNPLS